ncbi:hypothetical protein, partial [Staphylococcus aureus]
ARSNMSVFHHTEMTITQKTSHEHLHAAQLTYCNPKDKRNLCRLFLKNLKITQATEIKRIHRIHPPPDNVIAKR